MCAKYRGSEKIPGIPIHADTSPAHAAVDKFIDDVTSKSPVIEFDASFAQAEGRIKRFLTTTNKDMVLGVGVDGKSLSASVKQMKQELFKNTLGDVNFLAQGIKSAANAGLNDVADRMRSTLRDFYNEFGSIQTTINGKQLSGLGQILDNISELKSMSDFKFETIVSKQDVNRAEQITASYKETKKELKSIVNKVEYINRVLDENADSSLSEQKLKNYKQKVLGIQEILESFSGTDNPLLKGYLSDATVKAAEALTKISEKQALAVQRQSEAQEVLTASQEKSTKVLEKRLRLKKRVDDGGPKSVDGQYVTEDGLFEIDRDAEGWKVHRKNAKGMYELVGVYKTKNELQRDSALIAEQEAFTAQQLAQAREAEKNALLESTDASNEYLAAQNKLLEIQQKLKNGSEQQSFARNGIYAGREGRLTLAGRIGSEMSKFNLNDDEINQLIDSTYDQFSKVRNLIVDKQEWDSAIRSTLNEVAFGKQFSNKYSGDVLNGLRGVEEFRTIIDNVRSGVIGVSEAMEQTGALVEKIALDSGSESKEINQQNISKLQNLVASLKGKYGEESFNNIFGQTVGDFGELSASNALSLYDKLISKEQEYQAELEEQSKKRETIGKQVQEFMRQNQALVEKFGKDKDFEQQWANLFNKITTGDLQAEGATEQLIDWINSRDLAKSADQKSRLHEIFDIAKQNKDRDLKKNQPHWPDELRQRIDELQELIPQLKEMQDEVSQMGIQANDANFSAAFAAAGNLAQAVKSKEEDLRFYNSQLETTIKLEEFAAQAREKYGITTRSKKFSADTMSRYNELTMGLQNGLSVEDAISQLDEAVQKEQKLLDATQSVKKKLDVKPGTIGGDILSTLGDDADEAAESMAIAHDRLDNILDVISGAAAKAKFNPFENLQESEDVLKGFQDIIDNNLGDDSYKYIGSTIQGSKGVVHLKNSLGSTIDAVFRLKDGMMELDKDASKFNDKFTNFNVEAAVKRANAEVDNLESKLKGRKLDGISSLRELASNIVDNESLEKFNNELDIMQKKVSTLSGNTVSGKGMNPLANSVNEMENASIIVETYRKQLNRLGDVDGAEQAAAQLDTMTEAMNRFKDASDQAGEEQAYSDYSKAESKYKAWYKYAQESKREADLNANTVSDDSKNIKSTYDSILNTINKINSIDKNILKYQEKDGGTGLFSGYISGLQSEKKELLKHLNDISGEINGALGGVFDQGGTSYNVPTPKFLQGNGVISDFLNDTRTQAALTASEIEKLISSLQASQDIDLDAVTKYTDQFKEAQETYQRLSNITGLDAENKDYQALANIYGQIKKYREQLSPDPRDWTLEESAYLKSLTKTFTEYGNTLADVGEKEAKYFAGKSQYSKNKPKNEIQAISEDAKNLLNVQKQLEDAAKGIAEREGLGSPIITDFAKGADGIFRLDFSAIDKATSALRTFRVEAGSVTKGIFEDETTINKSFANIQAASKQLKSVGDLITRLGKSGFDIGDETAEPRIKKILELYRQLSAELDKGEGADQGEISRLVKDSKLAAAEVEKLYKKHQQLQSLIDSGDAEAKDLNMNGDIYKQMTESAQEFISKHEGVNAKIGKLNSTTGQLKFSFETAGGEVKEFTMSLDALGKQCVTQQTGVSQLKTKWEQLADGVSGAAKQFTTAFVGMNVFYEVISQLRQGYQYVKEIDLAMTELKKVTNETDMAYDNFLSTASKRASVIGSTVSDFTEATANFARLGYTMDESANMAETAIVYKNVADGLDTVEESTDSIISTMKAFGIESDNTMSIVDKFNAVGNSFAITSAGIGEALQRSASALFEAGNTIDESVALVTAANSVIQNPEQVGTALKTLALRLRGAKTELEEASLDTDNMAESTATLQAKLKALTHGKVDIMLDADTFKSTTQILREMADAWEDMSDIERASALELMGGKRQANILASVIKNFDTVESVIETSLNSQGSAMAENEKYLDSIQGKTDILTNSMQTLWNNALNSDFMKSLLDIANGFVQAADGAGLLNSAVSTFLGYKALTAKDNTFFDFLKIFKFDDDGFGLNKNSAIGQIISGAATGGISGAASAFKTLGTSIKGVIASVSSAGLTMLISMLAGFAINKGIEVIDNYIHRAEILKEEVNGLKDTFKDAQKTFDANLKTLTTSSDSNLYSTLEDEFTHLAQGVDKYGNNISLTTDQYERYKSICNDIVGIHPSIAAGYNSATEAIGNNASVLSELIELQKYQARQNVETLISDENFTKLAQDAANDYKDASSEYTITMANARDDLYGRLHQIFRQENQSFAENNFDADFNGTNQDDFMEYILKTLGRKDIDAAVEKYYNKALDVYDVDKFLLDHFDEIASNAQKFGKEYQDTINTAYYEIGKTIRDAEQNLNKEQDSLIDDFLLVPQGQDAGEAYEQLNSASKKFVTDWIKNSEQFKVASNKSSEEALANRDKIIQMVKDLSSDDFTAKLDGQQITGQDLLDQIYDFDTSSVNWTDYTKKMSEYVEAMWDMIGGENNTYGFKNVGELSISLGYNFIEDQNELTKDRNLIANRLDEKVEDINAFLSGLTAAEIQAFYKINWNDAEHSGINTIDGIRDAISKKMQFSGEFNIADYATNITAVGDSISTYKSALESLESGTFTMGDFISLIEKFPDLADGVDVSSKSFKGLSKNLRMAIKSSPDGLIDDLKELSQKLKDAGKSTDGVEQLIDYLEGLPTDSIESLVSKYGELESKINDATRAQLGLQDAMSKNPNSGYETRGEALNYIKDKMSRGEIGSESEVWDVAKEYGFKYDNTKSTNVNADQLAKYIAARNRWYVEGEDGGYSYEGIENFMQDVESAVNQSAELQKLMQWNYDEATGAFSMNFKNSDWDTIVAKLSEVDSLTQLTSEEFADLLTQIGQFHDINWSNATDLTSYIQTIAEGSGNASTKIDLMTKSVEKYVEKTLGKDIDFENLTADNLGELGNLDAEMRELLETYVKLRDEFKDPLGVSAAVDGENPLDTLLKIEKLQGAIKQSGKGLTVVDTDAFTSILQEAGYADEKIAELIKTIQTYQNVVSVTSSDPLGLSSTNKSIDTVSAALNTLGVEYESAKNNLGQPIALTIEAQSLIQTLASKGWTSGDISSYISTISSGDHGIDITLNGKVDQKTIDAAVAAASANTSAKVQFNPNTTAVDEYVPDNKSAFVMYSADYTDVDVSTPPVKYGTVIYDGGESPANGTAHASGTAHANGSWGSPRTETALVGELGPELLVRNGRWTTIGDNGAEFTQVKKGDIIFNHKQTEDLLSKGYVTGRGKLHGGLSAFASGTAYMDGNSHYGHYEFDDDGGWTEYDVNDEVVDASNGVANAAKKISDAIDEAADSVEEFEDALDFIEIRMEEFDERIGKLSAELENLATYAEKNRKIDSIIAENQKKYADALAGAKYYENYAQKYLAGMNDDLVAAAKNGAIAITEFTKEQDEATINAIQNYRDYAQKAADLYQQAEEIITEIRDSVIQKIDNIQSYGDAKVSIEDLQTEKLQNRVDYWETKGEIPASAYYGVNGGDAKTSTGMFENSYKKIEYWTPLLEDMQKEFNDAVKSGKIEVGTIEWYEQLEKLYTVQSEIDSATIEIEEFQNAINDLYWDNFDQLINRIDYLKDETQNLIDLMDSEDMIVDPGKRKYENGTVEFWTADDVKWSKEGLASLGLYAQQMEIAEYKAKQYGEAIDDLTKEYKAGHYSENEYYEKLNELKDAQYESIESYYDAQDAIKDLNKTRIDSVKKGIEKEIDAYSELIEKKKEALDAEKDMYDFQKGVAQQQKEISTIERKLAALAYDNSASARAQRAQLEAELAELKAELDETYYDRSIEEQQNALDAELENFQKEKDAEVEKMEEYLEDIKQVVADSLITVQANASGIYDTLSGKAEEYNLTLSDSILTPWKDGSLAVSSYQETFDTAMSSTMDQLDALKNKWQEVIDKMAEAGNASVSLINKENANYAVATKKEVEVKQQQQQPKLEQKAKGLSVGDPVTVKQSAQRFSKKSGNKWMASFVPGGSYTVHQISGDEVLIGKNGINTGWVNKHDLVGYAKGTNRIKEDQWAIIDELGEELRLIPDGNGRLAYMKKGTGVVPADLTANLMEWGKLDPTNMLDQNRPEIGVSPSVVNNTTEIHIDASVGELLHVEHLDGNNPAEISKIVDKAWDKRMKELNGYVRRYVR